MNRPFTIGLTRDFLDAQGKLVYRDIGLSVLDAVPDVTHQFLAQHKPEVSPEQLEGVDAVISLTPRYTRATFKNVERLVAVIRFGVGYDSVDVNACTDANVLLCITAGAVNYSVAEATVAWMLSLSHRVQQKDRLLRDGKWNERSAFMGCELRDRVLGVVGLGGIGAKLVELVRPFGMRNVLAFDPFTSAQRAAEIGVQLATLAEVLSKSDFVSIHCPLNEQTRNLIGQKELALLRPEAFLINTARGGIVDEAALTAALKSGRIAGAAIDVFESEPVVDRHPLADLDNVILAPHSIAWTHELFRDIGQMACNIALDVSRGKVPAGIVNKEVVERSGFQTKLNRFREEYATK